MIKVLDLFAGTQSVKKALEQMSVQFEYIGIDIYSPEWDLQNKSGSKSYKNEFLDLSRDQIVQKLLKVLPKNWKPDFIWASPPCNVFSRAITGTGGNYYFDEDKINKTIKIKNANFGKGNNRKVYLTIGEHQGHINSSAKKGLKMFENTKKDLKTL